MDNMDILVIGAGAIGSAVAEACESIEQINTCYVIDHHLDKIEELCEKYEKIERADKFIPDVDLVIEAASQGAVREFGPISLKSGIDFMMMSVGAFVDEGLRDEMITVARQNNVRIYAPTGALCGLDAVQNASQVGIQQVILETRKPPSALDISGELKEPTVLFEGAAREAVKKFPKNINVAAILSLSTHGFDSTRVKIVCDPGITRNIHKITFKGDAGEFTGISKNAPSPDNPRTSYLAALSAVGALKRICGDLVLGI